MRENTAKRTLYAGGAVLAINLNFVHTGFAEFLGRLGYNPIVFDAEHGPLVDDTIEEFARACELSGTTPVLRIVFDASTNPIVQRYMNLGIQGLHIPSIQSADQARAVVDAATYRPLGKRGAGTYRINDYGVTLGSWPEFTARANNEVLIKCTIEDDEGFKALPEIVKVPGVDVVSFGLTDLAESMGIPGQKDHPKLIEAVDKAIKVIRDAGKIPGLTTNSVADVEAAYKRGGRYLTTSVARVFMNGTKDYMSSLKALG